MQPSNELEWNFSANVGFYSGLHFLLDDENNWTYRQAHETFFGLC